MQEAEAGRAAGLDDADAVVAGPGVAAVLDPTLRLRGTGENATIEAYVSAAYDSHAERLKAFARAIVRDDGEADDLVQDAYVRLVREAQAGRRPDNVSAWLYRVCGNLAVSRGRRTAVARRMRSLLVDRGHATSPEDHAVRRDRDARVVAGLQRLPRDMRVALLLAAQGVPAEEIGAAIGRSAGATRTHLSRARVRLRAELGAAGEELD